jgi:pimeloyl-ACP methyl ester carboxylesterase/DNA-binding CsgD family transcriptional regulator
MLAMVEGRLGFEPQDAWMSTRLALMERQEVRYATTEDGVRIAWARHGRGPALIRVGTWMTHLEYDWESPVWRHWLSGFGEQFQVIRYDERGCGLSDRQAPALTLEGWLLDLEAVIEAAGLERFALFGMSQAGAIAIAYAARHPEPVSHLVIHGGFAIRRDRLNPTPAQRQEADVLEGVMRIGWGRQDPAFRRIFTKTLIPEASELQMRWFDELQRRSTSPENAVAIVRSRAQIDVTEDASHLSVPTLVLHAVDDARVPFEEGRYAAELIRGARFLPLKSRNHILLADEPAWRVFLREVTAFLTGQRQPPKASRRRRARISTRELDVLHLVAEGHPNTGIAGALGISVRTVEHHLANVYNKLGVSGKSARAAAAAWAVGSTASSRSTRE